MHAFNAARAFTGKNKIAVFSGGYHGAVFSFGSGKVAQNAVNRDDWVIGKYNDVQSAKTVIEETPGLAAVVVEAMQGAGGGISGTEEFLFQIQVRWKHRICVECTRTKLSNRIQRRKSERSSSLTK